LTPQERGETIGSQSEEVGMRKTTPVAVIVTALAVLPLAAGTALSHTKSYSTSTTLTYEERGADFSGKLTSALSACKKNREVSIVTQGTDFGEGKSDKKGDWFVSATTSLPRGNQATITIKKKVVKKNSKHKHTCKAVSKSYTRP
jgi:hypothetical protein